MQVALIDYDDGNNPQIVGPFPGRKEALDWLTEHGYYQDDKVWSVILPLDPP